jgi:hypothetical protein
LPGSINALMRPTVAYSLVVPVFLSAGLAKAVVFDAGKQMLNRKEGRYRMKKMYESASLIERAAEPSGIATC